MSTPEEHTLKSFDEELDALNAETIEMGALALNSLERAVGGLMSGDRETCTEVVADDEVIDQLEMEIDKRGMAILLRYNPVASDLRFVISSLNIGRSLERVGDHAVNIARRARKVLKRGELVEAKSLESLYNEVRAIVTLAIKAYSDRNEQKALTVIDMDGSVDSLHKLLSKNVSNQISKSGDNSESLVSLLFISRSLERIGDLAVNIAEDVVFIASAEDIRHSS